MLNENAMRIRRSWKHKLSPMKTLILNNGTPHSIGACEVMTRSLKPSKAVVLKHVEVFLICFQLVS